MSDTTMPWFSPPESFALHCSTYQGVPWSIFTALERTPLELEEDLCVQCVNTNTVGYRLEETLQLLYEGCCSHSQSYAKMQHCSHQISTCLQSDPYARPAVSGVYMHASSMHLGQGPIMHGPSATCFNCSGMYVSAFEKGNVPQQLAFAASLWPGQQQLDVLGRLALGRVCVQHVDALPVTAHARKCVRLEPTQRVQGVFRNGAPTPCNGALTP